jgi:hypothetical protein
VKIMKTYENLWLMIKFMKIMKTYETYENYENLWKFMIDDKNYKTYD